MIIFLKVLWLWPWMRMLKNYLKSYWWVLQWISWIASHTTHTGVKNHLKPMHGCWRLFLGRFNPCLLMPRRLMPRCFASTSSLFPFKKCACEWQIKLLPYPIMTVFRSCWAFCFSSCPSKSQRQVTAGMSSNLLVSCAVSGKLPKRSISIY